jgi:hypothetical protein
MKPIEWNEEKNQWLQQERGVSFDEILLEISSGNEIDILASFSRPGQKIFVVNLNDYIYYVPFVEDEDKIFLKTIYASRKGTKKYLHK